MTSAQYFFTASEEQTASFAARATKYCWSSARRYSTKAGLVFLPNVFAGNRPRKHDTSPVNDACNWAISEKRVVFNGITPPESAKDVVEHRLPFLARLQYEVAVEATRKGGVRHGLELGMSTRWMLGVIVWTYGLAFWFGAKL